MDVIKKAESAVKFVWKYNPRKLTMRGLTSLSIDLLSMCVSYMFIVYFPKEYSSEPMIQWIGAAGLLVIIVYVFLPAFSRVFYGYYEHYVEEDDAGAQ